MLIGRVRSVHRAAVYVDLRDPAGLFVVAIEDVGGVPGGILVRDVADLRRTGIQPGMTLCPSADGWSFPAAGIAIVASRAMTWSPALPTAATLRLTPEVARAAAAARRVTVERSRPGGLAPLLSRADGSGDPWLTRARALVGTQLEALARADVTAAVGPTIELIGLGIGLTPSGDDYLVGLLAGLEATLDPARHELAAAIATHAPGRTTAIGAAALDHATQGAFGERLHEVLVAVATGRLDDLAGPIERAMAYGATSGSDTLVGLLSAVDLAFARSQRIPRAAA